MTKRQRVEAVYNLQKADRIPFAPATYEHKGKLVGKAPSEICRNAEALYAGLKAELAVYDPDLLVIGIDVYNVKAEAMGCKVVYFENSDEVPAIVEPLIKNPSDLGRLGVPDPDKDGRMPVYLQVAEALGKEIGSEIIIRGAVTGPFSMATSLVGVEKLLIATVEDSEFVEELLRFGARSDTGIREGIPGAGCGAHHLRLAGHAANRFAARFPAVGDAAVPGCGAAGTESSRRPFPTADHRGEYHAHHGRSAGHWSDAVLERSVGQPGQVVRKSAGGADAGARQCGPAGCGVGASSRLSGMCAHRLPQESRDET
jgi:uroporphyrinogen decarboxylase